MTSARLGSVNRPRGWYWLLLPLVLAGCGLQPEQPSAPEPPPAATAPAQPSPDAEPAEAPQPEPEPSLEPVETIEPSVADCPPPAPTPKPKPAVCPALDDRIIVGAAEYVILSPPSTRQRARIDTGAATSSLGVADYRRFERDGERWIEVTLPAQNGEPEAVITRPLARMVRIKRHDAPSVRRPVIRLTVKLGSIEEEIEFTLADRDDFNYPVLIGRNLLSGRALVDVSRKYITLDGPVKP